MPSKVANPKDDDAGNAEKYSWVILVRDGLAMETISEEFGSVA